MNEGGGEVNEGGGEVDFPFLVCLVCFFVISVFTMRKEGKWSFPLCVCLFFSLLLACFILFSLTKRPICGSMFVMCFCPKL